MSHARMKHFLAPLFLLTMMVGLGGRASAQPSAESVPPVLRPWVPWVLEGDAAYGCTRPTAATEPDRARDPICVWPGELRIDVADGGASFVLRGTSDRRSRFALPGNERIQPVDVTLDGRPAVVLVEDGRAVVEVEAGEHRVEGRLAWSTRPETLRVPDEVARVLLVEDGEVSVATRTASGDVWLRARQSEALGEDRVTLEVHRRLDDGVPLTLTTRVQVRAAGRARELLLGDVLPEGAVPVDVQATLPVRLLPTGELTMQLRAGEFSVVITALVANPETSYRRSALEAPWPEQEVWVWAPDESLRQVELSGATGIDPARTSLPDEWRSFSAYLVGRDANLTLRTSRRGEPTPPPNELTLDRTVWLDENGGGFTARDVMSVSMHSEHRVALAEGELGRVSIGGEDQLITEGADGRPGVELRATRASITAEWRAEGRASSLPAVGWSEDAQGSSTRLNLPPGWELVHASGVDRAPGTLVDQWSLLSFFALLIITAAIAQVMGLRYGVLAFVTVGLSYHVDDAPRWVWLSLAVLLALHRALAARKFERVVRYGYHAATLVAVVSALVFAGAQTRYALHPQLAPSGFDLYGGDDGLAMRSLVSDGEFETAAPAAEVAPQYDQSSLRSENTRASGRVAQYASNSAWLDPNAVVQTGFGLPTWTWNTYTLSFDGPVARDHRIGLVLSPPWMTRLRYALRALLTLGLLGVALRLRPRAPAPTAPSDGGAPPGGAEPVPGSSGAPTEGSDEAFDGKPRASDSRPSDPTGAGTEPPAPTTPRRALALSAGLAVLLASLLLGASARAQEIPSPEVLEQLRARLTTAPPCERCADANRLTVRVEGDRLVAEIEISARAMAAYPLPGPTATWTPESVTLDGRPTTAIVRMPSGFLHARVPEGVHTLRLEGPIGGRDSLTLAFGRAPRSLSVTGEGWEVDGLTAENGPPESVQLRRLLTTTTGADAERRSELPTWLEVERRLDIGVRWTLTSVVRRRSPATSPAVVRIPLLPGESVTDSSVTVEGGQALVTLGQNASELRWTSTLEPADTVTLTAPEAGRLSEVWVLACTALWQCASEGIAPTESASGSRWEPRFHPWPGESLTLTLTRPAAAEGRSITVDRASLTVNPGVRLTSASLDLGIRTSVSSPVRLQVPSDADVRSLSVDGDTRPLQREGDDVVIALQPGSHSIQLQWQEARGWETAFQTPQVTVDQAVVNAELIVESSNDRWVLFLSGPAWGPAVLFWGYLALALLLAVVLARKRSLPLRLHDWLLLLVGLTQIPAAAGVVVIGWFFLLESRKDTPLTSGALFNLRQLFIIGYTFVTCGLLLWAVQAGLLGDPEMGIEGPGSWSQHLRFFTDRSTGALPVATLFSVPTWVFRVLMFSWALWLAFSLVLRWSRWGWAAFSDGALMKPLSPPKPPAGPGAPPVAGARREPAVEREEGTEPPDGMEPSPEGAQALDTAASGPGSEEPIAPDPDASAVSAEEPLVVDSAVDERRESDDRDT
ncbi:MAG: hypothetical protein H6726_08510 [Sandaracinaceae bacterium]|nr:hypothetical protein [Sandaracinaceae bacterium]